MMFFSYAALVGAILFGSAQIIRSVGYSKLLNEFKSF
jgi:hypothetical protein